MLSINTVLFTIRIIYLQRLLNILSNNSILNCRKNICIILNDLNLTLSQIHLFSTVYSVCVKTVQYCVQITYPLVKPIFSFTVVFAETQSLTRRPQILVLRIPTVGLATEL